MEKQTIEVIKNKDEYKYSVEIKENSKGEPAVTVKVKTDESIQDAGDKALAEYKRVKEELKK